MSSYRRYVAQHGGAVHRAREMINRHALETGPVIPVPAEAWAEDTFRGFAERLRAGSFEVSFGPMNPDLVDERLTEMIGRGMVADRPLIVLTNPDPVLAYRSKINGRLWCLTCPTEVTIKLSVPLTSDDLPDGGICRVCGVDVLIPVVPAPNPCCSICKHAPHGGEAGCHCGCRGTAVSDALR